MAKRLLLIALFVRAIAGFGQQTAAADSLLRVIRGHPARDSNRVTSLLRLADAIVYTDAPTAMRYADEALAISEEQHWTKGIALSWRQKGNAYYVFSDNPAAMDCYIKALNSARPLAIRELDASLFNNLANIYSDEKQFDKALNYYGQFLDAARELRSGKEETIALVNMGTVYSEIKEHGKAISCGLQALEISRRDKIDYFIPIILNNLGVAYVKKGDADSALDYFRQSITLGEKFDNKDARGSSLEETGKIYLLRGDYSNADRSIRQALAIGQELHSAERLTDAWQSLSQLYEKQHDYKKALDAYRQYILFRDSVSNDEKRSSITKKEMQFDFERKESATKAASDKQAAVAQAEIRRQELIRKGMVAGVTFLLIAGLCGFLLYKRRRDADMRRKESDLKALVAETEMKVLRLQMNPHFIFNSLNSISDYISRNETTTATYFLSKFAKMMRQVLEHSEKSEITLAEDLQVVETYIQLETLRLRNELRYEIVIDKDIDPEVTMVPPLIAQPFVENSIWHGLSGRQGQLSIRIHRSDGMMCYIVEDNGIGRKEAAKRTPAGKRSMALRITQDRLDILNQTRGKGAGLEIFDLSDGTRVELRLPLELNY